jgi:hypothetical protein
VKFEFEPDVHSGGLNKRQKTSAEIRSDKYFSVEAAMGTFSEPLIIDLSLQLQKGCPIKQVALFVH